MTDQPQTVEGRCEMAKIRKQNNTTARAAVAIGGGALLLWLIDRGSRRRGADGIAPTEAPPPSEVYVRIGSGDRLDLDGVSSNLPAAVARAGGAGVVHVVATGDAREGWVVEVMRALEAAGAVVDTSLRNGAARTPRVKLPRYDARKGWKGGDSRTLYTFTDPATGRLVVRPGGFEMPFGPQALVRVATRDEAEQHWQRPLHAGWTTAGSFE